MAALKQWAAGNSCLAKAPGWGARYFPGIVHEVRDGKAVVVWNEEDSCSVVPLGWLLPPPPEKPSKETTQDHPPLFRLGHRSIGPHICDTGAHLCAPRMLRIHLMPLMS